MKVSGVVGFCDREGSSFFQEWSAVFVGEGQQGERVIWHYPRLQAMSGIAEANVAASGGYDKVQLECGVSCAACERSGGWRDSRLLPELCGWLGMQ